MAVEQLRARDGRPSPVPMGEPGELVVGFDDEAVQDIERADEADAAQVVAPARSGRPRPGPRGHGVGVVGTARCSQSNEGRDHDRLPGFLYAIAWWACVIGAYYVAKNKGRNRFVWFLVAMFVPVIGLLIVAVLPRKVRTDDGYRPSGVSGYQTATSSPPDEDSGTARGPRNRW